MTEQTDRTGIMPACGLTIKKEADMTEPKPVVDLMAALRASLTKSRIKPMTEQNNRNCADCYKGDHTDQTDRIRHSFVGRPTYPCMKCGMPKEMHPEHADQEMNRSSCPYYKTKGQPDPRPTCTFGCYDEPECITCEPEGGWPVTGQEPKP